MDVVYLGSGAFGVPTLARLAERHQLRAIVTQPDRPAGRGWGGGVLTPTPVALWAAERAPQTPLFKTEKVNAAEVVAEIRGLQKGEGPQALVVIAFGQKLGRALLDGVFAVNLHASLLPRWRGAAPINAAILAGDTHTGNSVITLAERMDAGLILAQSQREIPPEMTAGELHDLLSADGPDLLLGVLDDLAQDKLRGVAQDEAQVTIAPKLTKADGWVDFAAGSQECRRRIHGLTPWPGVIVQIRGSALPPLKLLRVQAAADGPEEVPGTLVDAAAGILACGPHGTQRLRVLEVQPPGKRKMNWEDFSRGARIADGEVFQGRTPA
jgi:methionyl-tRNA formyltransferase